MKIFPFSTIIYLLTNLVYVTAMKAEWEVTRNDSKVFHQFLSARLMNNDLNGLNIV